MGALVGGKGNLIFFSDLLVIKRLFESMLVFFIFFAQMYLPQGHQELFRPFKNFKTIKLLIYPLVKQ